MVRGREVDWGRWVYLLRDGSGIVMSKRRLFCMTIVTISCLRLDAGAPKFGRGRVHKGALKHFPGAPNVILNRNHN